MVEIEDDDRLAELCIWANYERREHGECRVMYIREADADLLRRSGGEVTSDVLQGDNDVRVTTFRFRGFVFRYLYSISGKVAHQPPSGQPC